MALTLSTILSLNPVYNRVEVEATESTATSAFTYQFEVSIDGTLEYTIVQNADPNLKGVLNLTSLIQNHFQSSAYTNSSTTFETVPDAIVRLNLTVKSFNAAGSQVDSVSTGNRYFFNGVVQDFEEFDINNYLFNNNAGNFLTKLQRRRVTLATKAFLQTFDGDFNLGSSNPVFTGIKVTAYQKNGTTGELNVSHSTGSTPSLISINVSPAYLNGLTALGDLITSDTAYYTVEERTKTTTNIITFEIVEEKKIDTIYDIHYVNSLGAVDSFAFTKSNAKNFTISRNIFQQQRIQKQYYTDADQTITAWSDWVTEEQSAQLQDLWYTPSAKYYNSVTDKFYDINILTSNITIRNKYNNNRNLIQYQVPFRYSSNFKVQRY